MWRPRKTGAPRSPEGEPGDEDRPSEGRATERPISTSLEEFEAAARSVYESIPTVYRSGIEELRVRRAAMPHPGLADVFTLGECRVVDWASPLGSSAEIHSEIILYYGSFLRLAELDPEFDWEDELWETISHEVQHHLEYRADVTTLEERDYADDHSFRRAAGESFDPHFYRAGEPAGEGVFRVGDDWYVEAAIRQAEPARIEFRWRGALWSLRPGGPPGDVTYVRVLGLETGPGDLWAVATRKGSWLRSIWRGGPRLVEYEAAAEPLSES